MKKTSKRMISILLSAAILCSTVFGVSALSSEGEPYGTPTQQRVDRILDGVMDFLVGGATKLLLSADNFGFLAKSRRFPTVEEYTAAEHPGFYRGTDGALTGEGWSLGYAGRSVIPVYWRRNAQGEQDPNGMCLDRKHFFGGYLGSPVSHIYDDEQVNLAVLSAGTDRNHNGVQDIVST